MALVKCRIKIQRLDDLFRREVIQAELRYQEQPDVEARNEYRRALKEFKDYVLYRKLPVE